MQVPYLGRAPRTKEALPDFLKWRRVTRPPLVFCGLTGSQWTPGFWGVTSQVTSCSTRLVNISSRAHTSRVLTESSPSISRVVSSH